MYIILIVIFIFIYNILFSYFINKNEDVLMYYTIAITIYLCLILT